MDFDSGRYLNLRLHQANRRQEMEESYICIVQANIFLSLLIQSLIKHMWNFKNKYTIGKVINKSSHFKVSPNLNTFALSYCRVVGFIMLNLLVKACRVHSRLFLRELDFVINF